MSPHIIAYYALHYGAEYLQHSISSIYPAVDKIFIVYTPVPSHGYKTALPNPEHAGHLATVLQRANDPHHKIEWFCGQWGTEGDHRNYAVLTALSKGADLILTVDHDEVWDTESLAKALDDAWASTAALFRVPFVHFWRSFGWACYDQMQPVRIQKSLLGQECHLETQKRVYHFGYAQRPEMVRYKASIHGHRAEWRNGWFEEKFLAWSPYPPDGARVGDVHPTCGGIWYPERFDKSRLPTLMRTHPYWDKELIE